MHILMVFVMNYLRDQKTYNIQVINNIGKL